MRNRFVLVVLAVILVSILLFGMLASLSQNVAFSSYNQIPTKNSEHLSENVIQQSSNQSDQLPSFTPLPIETSLVQSTPTSITWNPLSPLPINSRGLITNGDRTAQKVALTFDVCQREGDLAGYDSEIVRILNETQTPATFFLGGLWMRDHQAETLELAGNPLFELGNHSWSHLDFSAISSEEINQEIQWTQQQMFDILGYQTNIFRLPYGTYNDTAVNLIGENGLYTIQWDVVSGDPDPNIDAASMTPWVLQQVNPGSIIIMHANGRGWHTSEALPAIIQTLNQDGYSLVTISELLNIEDPRSNIK